MLKSISGLAIASLTTQLAQLLAQPLLSKIYTPSDFGNSLQVSTVATFLSIICGLQIHNYIVITINKTTQNNLIALGITVSTLLTALTFTTIHISPGLLFKNAEGDYSSAVAILLLTMCYSSLARGGVTASGEFKFLIYYTLIRTATLLGGQIAFGIHEVTNGLIYGLIVGEALSLIIFSKKFHAWLTGSSKSEVEKTFTILKERKFFISASAQEITSVAASLLPAYLMVIYYGSHDGGQFALAHRIAWAPFLLLTQSISPILYNHIAKLKPSEILKSKIFNIHLQAIALSLTAIIILTTAQPIFLWIFESAWSKASVMCMWLSIWAAVFLTSLPYRLTYRVYSLQHIQLCVDGLTLLAIYIAFNQQTLSSTDIVATVSIIGSCQNLALIIISRIKIAHMLGSQNKS